MSQTVITSAFEQLKAQEAANGGVVILDEFVFANIPNLDITSPIDRGEGLPDAALIVHRQAVAKTGMVNNNAVVYSVVMGADVGDFDFNWVGLVNSANNVVAMIVHAPTQKKIRTATGQQGNVLTRSFLMEYNGASEQTQIITPADTWQIDFTARLNGVDERIRCENMDIYGEASFLGDGFLVSKSGSQYVVKKGVGYVAGVRAELLFDQNITISQKPVKVWADVAWRGTLTSVWASTVKLTIAETLENYTDNDEQHYVYAIAEIKANGTVQDCRSSGIGQDSGIISELNKKQPLDATLTAIAGLETGIDKIPYFSGIDVAEQADFTEVGRDLVGSKSVDDLIKYFGLSEPSGLIKIGQCADMSSLRKLKFTEKGQQVFLKEHTAGLSAGGGIWYCHSLLNDNNYVDDNGCQIISDSGQILRRKDLRNISSDLFGLTHGGDIISCLRNMYKASRTFCIEDVLISRLPPGQYYIGDTQPDGSNIFIADVSDGLNFNVRGLSVGNNGPLIYHKGNGVLMRIKRDHNNSKQFWVTGGFECLRVMARNDTLDGNNTYTGATPFQVSDMWGTLFKDLFISGYDNNSGGAAISLYNDTAWTEKPRFDNVMIRGSVVGVRLHRNKANGSTATDSFFSLTGSIDMNAGVPAPCTYMRIGDGTANGACTLYGHDFTIRGWMSRSSWHTGVDVSDYSRCVSGRFTFIWDGYGISTDATTEVLHIIRARGANARFDCEVVNISEQGASADLRLLQLIWNTCMYTQETTAIDASLNNAYPIIRPKGMKMSFGGKFTAEERVSGKVFSLNYLLPNQRLRIRLHSWLGDRYQPQVSEWDVIARGTDFPCIVVPLASQGANTFKQSDALGTTTLTLTNGRPDNSLSYSENSGRKIQIVLPANPSAAENMAYKAEIEVL